MINVLFKNVGQGDSILIEWNEGSNTYYGLIDCNLYEDKNPLLEEIRSKKIKRLEFIILSHLHYDHYSGFGELLDHCIDNSIVIKIFLHTFTTEFLPILKHILLSQKQQKDTAMFFAKIQEGIERGIIEEIDDVSNNFRPIHLYGATNLKFLAPFGIDYVKLARQRANYEHKRSTTVPDFNVMSTIIEITNGKKSLLLTSDATNRNFRGIQGSVTSQINLAQVPHHGSTYNLQRSFWNTLNKCDNCPSIFSVGDVKKDKLPNKEVVEFFELEGFYNYATNFVYGLPEFYNPGGPSKKTSESSSLTLSTFSKKKSSSKIPSKGRFFGDQLFELNL